MKLMVCAIAALLVSLCLLRPAGACTDTNPCNGTYCGPIDQTCTLGGGGIPWDCSCNGADECNPAGFGSNVSYSPGMLGTCCAPSHGPTCECGSYVDNCHNAVNCYVPDCSYIGPGLVCSPAHQCLTPDVNLGTDSAPAHPAPAIPRGFAFGLAGVLALAGIMFIGRRR